MKLIKHAVYAPVRRAADDGHEFCLFSEAQLSPWVPRHRAVAADASYERANPIVRIARFTLTEEG